MSLDLGVVRHSEETRSRGPSLVGLAPGAHALWVYRTCGMLHVDARLDVDVHPYSSTIRADVQLCADAPERTVGTQLCLEACNPDRTHSRMRVAAQQLHGLSELCVWQGPALRDGRQQHARRTVVHGSVRLFSSRAFAHHVGRLEQLPPAVVAALPELQFPGTEQRRPERLGETGAPALTVHERIVRRSALCRRNLGNILPKRLGHTARRAGSVKRPTWDESRPQPGSTAGASRLSPKLLSKIETRAKAWSDAASHAIWRKFVRVRTGLENFHGQSMEVFRARHASELRYL